MFVLHEHADAQAMVLVAGAAGYEDCLNGNKNEPIAASLEKRIEWWALKSVF